MGYRIFANYNLNFEHELLTKQTLLDYVKNKTQFEKTIILIDEIYLIVDSRNFASNTNKIFSWFILQTAKRDVHLLSTAQVLNSCEKRFRENLNFMVFCDRFIHTPQGYKEVNSQIRMIKTNNLYIRNNFLIKKPNYLSNDFTNKTFFIKALPIFKLYDTKQLYGLE